jgi:hypothetical protein
MNGGAPVSGVKRLGSKLRSLWAMLVMILLLVAGVALGATRYIQSDLERDATRDARKVVTDVIGPMLVPADAASPIRGPRYEALLAAVEEHVLAGPINRVRLWRADGTILFADDPDLVGQRDPEMRDEIHAAVAGTAESWVAGARFRTLTSVRVGDPPVVLAVELDRSHPAIVEQSRERWYPWAIRAGVGAGISLGLYVATVLVFALLDALVRRRAARRRDPARNGHSGRGRASTQEPDESLPIYMQPGFQEEVQARHRTQEALAAAERERRDLRDRARQLEAELEEAKRRLEEPEPSRPASPTG